MIKVTLNYKKSPDQQYASEVTFLVDTSDHVCAVVTASHAFYSDPVHTPSGNPFTGASEYVITRVYTSEETEVLAPLGWDIR
jgi:hypothetical protein